MKDSIDKVLAGLREVQTPGGLEGRVLRRLEAKAVRRPAWGWRVAAVGLTLVLVGTMFVGGRRGEHTPGAEARILSGREKTKAEALGYLQAEAGDSRAEGGGHIAGAKARILSGAKMSGLKPGRISEATAGARANGRRGSGEFPGSVGSGDGGGEDAGADCASGVGAGQGDVKPGVAGDAGGEGG